MPLSAPHPKPPEGFRFVVTVNTSSDILVDIALVRISTSTIVREKSVMATDCSVLQGMRDLYRDYEQQAAIASNRNKLLGVYR